MCTNDLEIFESKLAFLLLKEILKIDKVKYFGFSEEYIKNLLTRYKKETENQYDEYYYNEKTGVLSKIIENGFYRPFTYIPSSVANEIEKRKTNLNIKRIVR